jgi:hypothetical protein
MDELSASQRPARRPAAGSRDGRVAVIPIQKSAELQHFTSSSRILALMLFDVFAVLVAIDISA